jgi:hypothetical protein
MNIRAPPSPRDGPAGQAQGKVSPGLRLVVSCGRRTFLLGATSELLLSRSRRGRGHCVRIRAVEGRGSRRDKSLHFSTLFRGEVA